MPVVAMTREMGSLGKDVASQLSERLGKKLVNYEMIDPLGAACESAHVENDDRDRSGAFNALREQRSCVAGSNVVCLSG